jgi:hypothetical protein
MMSRPDGRRPIGFASAEVRSVGEVGRGVSVGERCGEETVGPVFGVAAAVGERELDFGVAEVEAGELVGEPVAVDVFQLEQGAVAGLDDHGREGELGEPLQLEGEGSVGEGGGEVVEALSFDRGDEGFVGYVHGIVAGGDGRSDGVCTLRGEPVRVALAGSTVIVTGCSRLRRRGILPPGLAARAVFWVCQKIASRPFTSVSRWQ